MGSERLRGRHSQIALLSAALGLLCLRPLALAADTAAVAAARGLVARVLPAQAGQIDVELIPPEGGSDVFEVESRGDRLVLRGNNGVSVASALGWYLRQVAHCQISADGDNLALPATLPRAPQKYRQTSLFRYRSFFNYCTFGYTMAWWDWKRWQREIDWMALQGVNMPLAATGQEAVWQATLRRYRMSDEEIRKFFVGPAFLPWQWMTNIEGWAGPLPQSWIESHRDLGRLIIDRERGLGMTPILQGFSGCVPLALAGKYPAAKIQRKAVWMGVGAGTAQLDPLDPLFGEMGRVFLEEQRKLFGPGHLYAADPFHESTPPDSSPEYLTAVGHKLVDLLTSFDPKATLVMQGWTEREGIVRSIPPDRIVILDLTGRRFRLTQAYWGRPWVAGVLHNYGGRTYLAGDLPGIATNALSLLGRPEGGDLVGIGEFPEGTGQNPVVYALATALTWMHEPPDLTAWIRDYAVARYGRDVPSAQAAWTTLRQSVYSQRLPVPTLESPVTARPELTLKVAGGGRSGARDYPVAEVWTAAEQLLGAAPELGAVDTYRFDLVDVLRQALTDLTIPLQREAADAYRRQDAEAFRRSSQRFLDLLRDLDALVGTRREFLLGKWIAEARRWGTNPEEKDLYERNARLLVTVWGPNHPEAELFDYANREWSGLIKGYYLRRWEKFIDYLSAQPPGYDDAQLPRVGVRPRNDANDFYRELTDWEYAWSAQHELYPEFPVGDAVATAQSLLAKWRPVMGEVYPRFDWSPFKIPKAYLTSKPIR